MKTSRTHSPIYGFTLVEMLLVTFVIVVLIAILFPYHRRVGSPRNYCINNLKEDGLALLIWAGDHEGHWPQAVSTTNGGAMELIYNGNVPEYFKLMSNELSTPKILVCPTDTHAIRATNFSALSTSNISYFVNLAATPGPTNSIVLGDDNLLRNGIPLPAGLTPISSNQTMRWSNTRHPSKSPALFADGHVEAIPNQNLYQSLPGPTTNAVLLAIP